MPSTYTLISSNVLSSSAASVTFSAIPSTYTDLVLRCSTRGERSAVIDNIVIRFNSDSANNYSNTIITGVGTTASSFRNANTSSLALNTSNGNTSTSSTFGSFEMYIPNYTATTTRPISTISLSEDNSTNNAYLRVLANQYRGSAAISSIVLTPEIGPNWLSGSSFYLYGIKNS